MNKKVLTLCASMLLASGMFGTANASEWYTDTQYVLNTGKYHLIHQVANLTSGSWAAATSAQARYYLSADENGTPKFSKIQDENAYWTITTVQDAGVTYYQFTNAKGNVLTYVHDAGGPDETTITSFSLNQTSSPVTLNSIYYTVGGTKYYLATGGRIDANNTEVEFSSTVNDARGFDNVEIDDVLISVDDLNAELQNGFQLQFGKTVDGEYEEFTDWATDDNGNSNVFAGTLYAQEICTTGTYYLRKGQNGDYIVLTDELWGGTRSDLNGTDNYKGYRFDLYNAHDFQQEIVNNGLTKNATFQIYKSHDFGPAYADSLIVTMPGVLVGDIMTADTKVRVFVADVNNQSWLTIAGYAQADDRLDPNKKDAKEAPYIRLGQSNIVDFKDFAGKVWNITDADNRRLSPDVVSTSEMDNFSSQFDPEDEILLNAPEGEWLPYKDGDEYGFVNRESGIRWNLSYRYSNGEYWVIRKVSDTRFTVWSSQYATGTPAYTINITEAASKVGKLADGSYHSITTAGYANSAEAVSKLEGKYLTIENGVTGATMYVGKDADDNVILTEDQAQAIEFRVKDLEHDYTSHSGLAGVDTLQHYTTYYGYDENGELSTNVKDTVRFQHFRLFEHFSEKYLVYDVDDHKFILSGLEAPENVHDDFNMVVEGDNGNNPVFSTFVLKEKADGNYNIVSYYDIDYPTCSNDHQTVTGNFKTNYIETNLYYRYNGSNSQYDILGGSLKMEGNVGKATVDNTANIYTHTNEDRIGLVDIATPEYMTVTGAIDTAKISLQRQPNFFLYEHNENGTNFLGMEHVADVEDMKAALLVDTAYVRNNTYKPQYLLAVGAHHVEPVYDSHPDQTIPHLLHADSTYGRFLVNMVDSAIVYGLDKKSNPYIHEQLNGNNYYRLAFIDGIHTGDKLILNTEGAKTTIDLSNNNDKVCTFAFRYVDEDREGVKIETLYGVESDGTPIRGWLKYQNNVPVVTNDYEDAHVFLVDNTTTEAPTANETITAEGAVSVVATDGAVVIKGAEGKNVVIATILGKVVANETVNSDNETIAVPAGIAVVSVDGESFKVVVK